MGCLGAVNPFQLQIVEHPCGSGEYFVEDPELGRRSSVELAGLDLVGAGQALLGLSMRWLRESGGEIEPGELPPLGDVRMRVRRREARLLSSLLRRHLARLPQPPRWMGELRRSLEEIDSFLRWEDP